MLLTRRKKQTDNAFKCIKDVFEWDAKFKGFKCKLQKLHYRSILTFTQYWQMTRALLSLCMSNTIQLIQSQFSKLNLKKKKKKKEKWTCESGCSILTPKFHFLHHAKTSNLVDMEAVNISGLRRIKIPSQSCAGLIRILLPLFLMVHIKHHQMYLILNKFFFFFNLNRIKWFVFL